MEQFHQVRIAFYASIPPNRQCDALPRRILADVFLVDGLSLVKTGTNKGKAWIVDKRDRGI